MCIATRGAWQETVRLPAGAGQGTVMQESRRLPQPGQLIERLLGPPTQPCEIRILPLGMGAALSLLRLALDAAGLLLALLHLLRLFAVSFRERRLGWFSDGVLLVGVETIIVYTKAGSAAKKKIQGPRSGPDGFLATRV